MQYPRRRVLADGLALQFDPRIKVAHDKQNVVQAGVADAGAHAVAIVVPIEQKLFDSGNRPRN